MKVNFETSLKETLRWEGGYSNHPEDNGGATQSGIIQRVYNSYRRLKGLVPRDVRKITKAEVYDIYKTNYWDQVSGDLLPIGLDFVVFDFAVNSGPNQAIKYLQRAINKTENRTLKVDGHLGPATLDAATSLSDLAGVIAYMCDARLGFVKRLSDWKFFGKGWTTRIRGVKAKGLQMAAEGLQLVQERPEVPEGLGKAGDDTTPSDTTWKLSVTGLVGALGTGLVSAVNNPFALVFMMAVLAGAGWMFYSYGKRINLDS